MMDSYPNNLDRLFTDTFPLETLEQLTEDVAPAIRRGEVAPLVGSGLSIPAGLPSWNQLVKGMVHRWMIQKYIQTSEAVLSPEQIQKLDQETLAVKQIFEDDLATVSYLRCLLQSAQSDDQSAQSRKNDLDMAPKSLGELIYYALYLKNIEHKKDEVYLDPLIPHPNDVHRHLIALFQEHSSRVWTSNYDDLLEEAASQCCFEYRTINPDLRDPSTAFSIAHLHGFLAPPSKRRMKDRSRLKDYPDPKNASLILAEDDYHRNTLDIRGWTNRDFYRLFDEYRVLILGMSLTDPNLRRVLTTTQEQSKFVKLSGRNRPRHFAVLRSISLDECLNKMLHQELEEALNEDKQFWNKLGSEASTDELIDSVDETIGAMNKKIGERLRTIKQHKEAASKARREYWEAQGVQILEVPKYESILPVLMRLRYETFGEDVGELWKESAKLIRQEIESPLDTTEQKEATAYLSRKKRSLQRKLRKHFSIDPQIGNIGIYLLKEDSRTLKLTFHSERPCSRDEREFSADPRKPSGLPGLVFVTGLGMKTNREDWRYNYGLNKEAKRQASKSYKGVIAVPIVAWKNKGMPIGVIYVTTRSPKMLSNLPAQELAQWLNYTGMLTVSLQRRYPAIETEGEPGISTKANIRMLEVSDSKVPLVGSLLPSDTESTEQMNYSAEESETFLPGHSGGTSLGLSKISSNPYERLPVLGKHEEALEGITPEQSREIIKIDEGKLAVVPPDFQRESDYHNLLRNLRDKRGLIRPSGGGPWEPGKRIEITPFGRRVLKFHREVIDRVALQ